MTVEFSQPILEYIRGHRNAIIATNRKQGAPQLTLISYDYDGNDFAISTRGGNVKTNNIARRPDVALAVIDGGQQLIVYGKARLVQEPEEVYQLHRDRMRRGASRQETDEELRDRLQREGRVVVVVEPQSYFPQTLRAP
jgi:PPOX class probable F420-dependent enzyme